MSLAREPYGEMEKSLTPEETTQMQDYSKFDPLLEGIFDPNSPHLKLPVNLAKEQKILSFIAQGKSDFVEANSGPLTEDQSKRLAYLQNIFEKGIPADQTDRKTTSQVDLEKIKFVVGKREFDQSKSNLTEDERIELTFYNMILREDPVAIRANGGPFSEAQRERYRELSELNKAPVRSNEGINYI
jgi:hypothetical protein